MTKLYVRVKGGGEICVPADQSMTTYVLIEQQDWFEKEIAVVRRLLRRGMHAIDIGANYGTYTLAMALAVGPQVHGATRAAAATIAKMMKPRSSYVQEHSTRGMRPNASEIAQSTIG